MERYVVGVVDFSFDYGRDRRRDHRAGYHGEFRATAQRVVTISGTTSSGEEIVRRIDVTQAWCKRRPTRVYIKKGDRLIACSGAWPATSRLTVDFYFTYYMKRYEYALHIEKGSFWTEDSVGIPWSYAFPDESVIESVLPDHEQALFLRSGKISVPSKIDGSEVRPGQTKQSAVCPCWQTGALNFSLSAKPVCEKETAPSPNRLSLFVCALIPPRESEVVD